MPKEVFLSHSSRNRRFVDRLAVVLRDHGVPVWYSRTSLKGAQQWHDEIGAALARCDWFIVVLSPSSVKSKWVKRELLFTLREDRYEDRIVPLLHRKCSSDTLSWTLSSFQSVSFLGSFEDGCRELLRVWGIGFKG